MRGILKRSTVSSAGGGALAAQIPRRDPSLPPPVPSRSLGVNADGDIPAQHPAVVAQSPSSLQQGRQTQPAGTADASANKAKENKVLSTPPVVEGAARLKPAGALAHDEESIGAGARPPAARRPPPVGSRLGPPPTEDAGVDEGDGGDGGEAPPELRPVRVLLADGDHLTRRMGALLFSIASAGCTTFPDGAALFEHLAADPGCADVVIAAEECGGGGKDGAPTLSRVGWLFEQLGRRCPLLVLLVSATGGRSSSSAAAVAGGGSSVASRAGGVDDDMMLLGASSPKGKGAATAAAATISTGSIAAVEIKSSSSSSPVRRGAGASSAGGEGGGTGGAITSSATRLLLQPSFSSAEEDASRPTTRLPAPALPLPALKLAASSARQLSGGGASFASNPSSTGVVDLLDLSSPPLLSPAVSTSSKEKQPSAYRTLRKPLSLESAQAVIALEWARRQGEGKRRDILGCGVSTDGSSVVLLSPFDEDSSMLTACAVPPGIAEEPRSAVLGPAAAFAAAAPRTAERRAAGVAPGEEAPQQQQQQQPPAGAEGGAAGDAKARHIIGD